MGNRQWIALLLLSVLMSVHVHAGDDLLSNSRAPYVHNIPLYDAEGRLVRPSRGSTTPFSMEATCARCHDVSTISTGLHFNFNSTDVDPGRPGEPWILNDFRTGTQLPISYRGWEGTWHPQQLGLSDVDFLKLFGRHLPGGGPGKPNPHVIDESLTRTEVFEIDCMVCHTSETAVYNVNDRKRLAEVGQFQAIMLQGMGLGVGEYPDDSPGGPGSTDPFAGFDPAFEDEEAREAVRFIYDLSKVDENDLVHFPIARRVSNESCFHCHTTFVHDNDMTSNRWHQDFDVHLSAGMSCVDCHSHGIDHKMTRGFNDGLTRNVFEESLSCQGCHFGVETETGPKLAGRKGAPLPGHEGIPPVHFDILSCTSCHSGPIPESIPKFMQTSMAHALGFPEFGRGNLTTPMINSPIFLKGEDGKISPHKVMWPAFWAWESPDGEITPILPEQVLGLTGRILSSRPQSRANFQPLSDETIAEALAALAARATGDNVPVYISAGLQRRLDGSTLDATYTEAGQPYAWPMAHDVRPASMALGARSCLDCHDADSPFVAGMVFPTGPASGRVGESAVMGNLMGIDMGLYQWWSNAFRGRPAFKILVLITMILTLLGAVIVTGRMYRLLAAGRGI